MTKAELIDKVHGSIGDRGVSKVVVNELCDCLFNCLGVGVKRDKRFTYPGFGTWTLKTRKARKGRNPQTGEEIRIKASKTVTFKPAPKLKGGL